MRTRRRGERVFGLFLLALALGLLAHAYGISGFSGLSSPGAFPMAVAAVMTIAATVIVVGNARAAEFSAAAVLPPVVTVFFLMVLAFAFVLDAFGFIIAATCFLLVAIGYLDRHSVLRTVATTLTAIVVIYIIFRLIFRVILPEGVLPERAWLAAAGDWLRAMFAGGP